MRATLSAGVLFAACELGYDEPVCAGARVNLTLPTPDDTVSLRVHPCVRVEKGEAYIRMEVDDQFVGTFHPEYDQGSEQVWFPSAQRCDEGIEVEIARDDDEPQPLSGTIRILSVAEHPRACSIWVESSEAL